MTKLRSGRRTANSGGDSAISASKGATKENQPAQKKRSAEEIEHPDTKILKKAKPSVCKAAEELVCPILQGLPIDPVIAEDGQIYERKEIEKYLKEKKDEDEILSPVTKQPLETKALVPSVHTRNVIEHLIESGIIAGDLADTWKERMVKKREEEEKVKGWKEGAEKGDTDAMYALALAYGNGSNGLEVDNEEAYKWYKKGADAGNVYCMAMAGECLLNAWGTEVYLSEGFILVSLAAEKGSNFACYSLGECYYQGICGVRIDAKKAKFWLEKAISEDCDFKHLNDEGKEEARAWLEEIAAEQEVESHDGDGSDE